ncbi:molecular chaperone [Atlantibacter hermannii]|uniref:fimbrial biogenesis chaperone n=1 Tax=Atlantibacter hermannii TaxID=565 RepID=UPI001C6FD25F|nr:molecular chaperone [Atlantibacter hermannii]MBW9431323.1 molecular chaperone [Atlantibacter hermannii]
MRKSIIFSYLLAALSLADCQAAGIQIGRTRVIYEAKSREVALTLVNKEQELPWLVQSWTDNGDEKTRGPFIITPPLFRLDPQKEQSLRITWTGAPLPTDRESLFYLNVRTIPATAKEEQQKNKLRLIYKTRLKMFWRPEALTGSPGETCEKLRFRLAGNTLQIINDGDFYSVFDSLSVGATAIKKADMIAPKSTASIPMNAAPAGKTVTWRCITDFGNASQPNTATLLVE